jgi:predicted amidohydrolase
VPVSLAICWDLIFPETLREAAVAGARLVLAPSAWESPHGAQYGRAASARALDNAFYVATANQRGLYGAASFDTPGGVYRFDGAPEGPVASVDLEALASYRAEFGTMLDELGVHHGEPRDGVRA